MYTIFYLFVVQIVQKRCTISLKVAAIYYEELLRSLRSSVLHNFVGLLNVRIYRTTLLCEENSPHGGKR